MSDTAKREETPDEKQKRKDKAGADLPKEIGGQDGPEPTRYGDWEKNGIVSDF
ncbi:MAG: succinate dehydrogenase assembly factor 4 [Pseudomonadota bacterium]